jgi:hypothetical protein
MVFVKLLSEKTTKEGLSKYIFNGWRSLFFHLRGSDEPKIEFGRLSLDIQRNVNAQGADLWGANSETGHKVVF